MSRKRSNGPARPRAEPQVTARAGEARFKETIAGFVRTLERLDGERRRGATPPAQPGPAT
ncbi:hypothetical protein IMF23_15310 [Chelatococcus daeguensis]|uniref:Uncharacterized protein n=1 Tax=Chelatococcus daeguensis TaxID=444444 RepID=A0AAC9JRH9_9HYPH|nr:hypothetical protein [Chelatococcus daeguensis]APF37029.1 hypothetical protein BOQ54_06545 [Chelatococcus daeguensis]KZE33610.1 hypothetical protein AVW15_18565 [Chelatococcus daeguensis]MBM3084810.1 hypothetical protein [Chelatococcus daeguensis]